MLKMEQPTSTPSGALAKLWRKILQERMVESSKLMQGVIEHVRKQRALKGITHSQGIGPQMSTLISELFASEMTFKTLMGKALPVISVVKVTISIEVTDKAGDTTTHSIPMLIDSNTYETLTNGVGNDECSETS